MQCSAALAGPQLSYPEHQALADFHDLAKLPRTEKKTNPTKPCGICTKNKVPKESRYFCEKCKDNPALCVDRYFRVYQQLIQQNRYCIISFLIFRREIYSKFVPLINLLVLTLYSK